MKSILSAAATLMLLGALATPCGAQTYPNRPVRVIVPFAPGGGSDIFGRTMAVRLSESIGQQVLVENRPGGNTLIGAELAARAAPDGYTLFLSTNGTVAINPSLYKKLPYDAVKDFAPVSLIGVGPNVLVVHPSLPVKSVKELIALAKAKPGELNYASGSTGSSPHIAGEMFKTMAGLDIARVNYKGSGPAVAAVVGGQVQFMFATTGAASPHMKSGRLRGLAVTTAEPSALAPGLPTVAAAIPGYEADTPYGVYVPARTPASIVARLNQEIVKILARPDVKERFFNAGVETIGSTSEQFAALMKADVVRVGKLVKEAGIVRQ